MYTGLDKTEKRLLDIILVSCVISRGDYILSSGRGSSVFFDMKPVMLDPEAANLIADVVLDRLDVLDVDAVGGLVMGAVPIISVVCAKSFYRQRPLQGFFVRTRIKDHGTSKLIEGNLTSGARVAIIEDVTTTGGSALRAVKAVRSAHACVVKVISIVDRLDGAAGVFRSNCLPFEAVFTKDDLIGSCV